MHAQRVQVMVRGTGHFSVVLVRVLEKDADSIEYEYAYEYDRALYLVPQP